MTSQVTAITDHVTAPSAAGRRGPKDKKPLSSSHPIYFDKMQSYFQHGLTSSLLLLLPHTSSFWLARSLNVGQLVLWGRQRGYTVNGFCPNQRSFSWERGWTESWSSQSSCLDLKLSPHVSLDDSHIKSTNFKSSVFCDLLLAHFTEVIIHSLWRVHTVWFLQFYTINAIQIGRHEISR